MRGDLGGPAALGLLVNESRARRLELSQDFYARLWVRGTLQRQVSDLWGDFARTVYPNDDLELSVRARFFREALLSFFRDGEGSFFNIAAGLTSYPFDLPASVACTEFDVADMISFKQSRLAELTAAGDMPDRTIIFKPATFESGTLGEVLSKIGSGAGKKCILLEGISYYLDAGVWKELLDGLRGVCGAQDVVLLDFWREADSRRAVFDRFRHFCKRHTGQKIRSFNFLAMNPGGSYHGFNVEDVTSVFSEERRFGEGILKPSSDTVMPEYYATLRPVCSISSGPLSNKN